MKNKVKAYWDTTDPSNPGWYAQVLSEEGEVIEDSMKVTFPVNLDRYGRPFGRVVERLLARFFPGYEIEVSS